MPVGALENPVRAAPGGFCPRRHPRPASSPGRRSAGRPRQVRSGPSRRRIRPSPDAWHDWSSGTAGSARRTFAPRRGSSPRGSETATAAEIGPIGNIPLGGANPSRVPCPPATRMVPRRPAAMASIPRCRACSGVKRLVCASEPEAGRRTGPVDQRREGRPARLSPVERPRGRNRSPRSGRPATAAPAAVNRSQKANRCCCPCGATIESSFS